MYAGLSVDKNEHVFICPSPFSLIRGCSRLHRFAKNDTKTVSQMLFLSHFLNPTAPAPFQHAQRVATPFSLWEPCTHNENPHRSERTGNFYLEHTIYPIATKNPIENFLQSVICSNYFATNSLYSRTSSITQSLYPLFHFSSLQP